MAGAMFPFRTSSIFRSRWMALFWAGGIIWTAVDYVGGSGGGKNEATDSPTNAEQAQAAALLNSFGQ